MFFENKAMQWLFFWGLEVAYFGPLDGPLTMDLQTPFNYVKYHLNPFSRF